MSLHLTVAAVAPALVVSYTVLRIVYNIFFHPLRSYPGPLHCRAMALFSHKAYLEGSYAVWIHKLHLKYGPVVRFAPNELSYIDAAVYKDAYSHRAGGFIKDMSFYGPDSYGNEPGLIRSDNVAHARQRKLVSHAFSDKALRDQEQLLKGYVTLLIKKLGEIGAKGVKTDLVKWYNFTTFDIMADLTFGEPLQLLEGSDYIPWIASIFGHIRMIIISLVARRWGLEGFMTKCLPVKALEQRKEHMRFSDERVDKRLARETDRPDIWTYILRHSDDKGSEGKGLTPMEMHSNGAVFMLAGTETTATELSGVTYYLLKNPEKMARLQKEIRTAFSSLDDMHMGELSQLPYLNACLEEGLRIYPPVPGGLPRVVPKEGAKVVGQFVPGGSQIQVSQYATHHSPYNFKDPDLFVPERWLPEGQKEYGSDRKDALQPFSHGPRNCLGKNLAYHEMRIILSSVLFTFDLELCPEADNWPNQRNFVIWQKGPLAVKVKPAKQK